MSAGTNTEITCDCGHTFEAWIWQSANATFSPELRQQILDGAMNVVECPACGKRFHVEVPFLYHDMDAKVYVWVYPRHYEKQSGAVHAEVQEMWEKVRRKVAPRIGGAFDDQYEVMVLFGMDALVRYLSGQTRQDGNTPST
jgi:hypothetical protein